jgi:hypothetical protein
LKLVKSKLGGRLWNLLEDLVSSGAVMVALT